MKNLEGRERGKESVMGGRESDVGEREQMQERERERERERELE